VLDSFDNADAWQLGTLMVERAVRDALPVIIDIRKPGLVLVHSAGAGTTIENEVWLKRKARTTFRFEVSTALLDARFAAQGVDQWTVGWFDHTRFTATGGAFPLRVLLTASKNIWREFAVHNERCQLMISINAVEIQISKTPAYS
jgi:uncharacterized protein (UPF0303 family)